LKNRDFIGQQCMSLYNVIFINILYHGDVIFQNTGLDHINNV